MSTRQSVATRAERAAVRQSVKGRDAERRRARAAKRYGYAIAERAYLSLITESEGTR